MTVTTPDGAAHKLGGTRAERCSYAIVYLGRDDLWRVLGLRSAPTLESGYLGQQTIVEIVDAVDPAQAQAAERLANAERAGMPCGWCGETLEACTRCRECGSHGSIVDGACGVCGAVSDLEAHEAAEAQWRLADQRADEPTVHVQLGALDAVLCSAALEQAIVSGEIATVELRTLLAALRNGAAAAGVELPATMLTR